MEEFVSKNILKKIVYSDNGVDKALYGYIISEDEIFIEVLKQNGFKQTINKKRIVTTKEASDK